MFSFRRSSLAALIVAGACIAGPSMAIAADMYTKAPPQRFDAPVLSWQGWYFGGNGGYANSYDKTGIVGGNAISQTILDIGALPASLDTRQSGWFGGAQLGYNWQVGQFLFGVETDFQGGDINGSASQTLTLSPLGVPLGLGASAEDELKWFGTLRARLGFLVSDRALIYATGGLAYGKVEHSASATLTAPAPFGVAAGSSVSDTKTGYVVGGGIEYAILPKWTIKTEYLYVDLGSIGTTYGATVLGTNINYASHSDLTYHLVRAGINYRF